MNRRFRHYGAVLLAGGVILLILSVLVLIGWGIMALFGPVPGAIIIGALIIAAAVWRALVYIANSQRGR